MRWRHPLALMVAVATIVYTEVLDLGDVKKYQPKISALPDGLQPNSIWVNQADGGFNIVFGQEIKSKVEAVLQRCGGQPSPQCHRDVVKVLEGAIIQNDKHLERRFWGAVASALILAWKTIVTFREIIAAILVALWAVQKGSDTKGYHIPESAASNAVKLPAATPITVSAGGSAIVTITKAPDFKYTLQGSVTPSAVAITSAVNGYSPGDLSEILDIELAVRLDRFMQEGKECRAGADFDKTHPAPPSSKKRANIGTPGQVLCASRAVIDGVQPGGLLNDLLLLSPSTVQYQVSPSAGSVREAATMFNEYVREVGPLVAKDLPPDTLGQLGNFIFLLAYHNIVEGFPLAEKNRIKATMIITGAGTIAVPSATGGGPHPTGLSCPPKKKLICGKLKGSDCRMKIVGEGKAKRAVCDDTQYKECECTPPAVSLVTATSKQKFRTISRMRSFLRRRPKCPVKVTAIPAEVFSSKTMSIHKEFCKGWVGNQQREMTVNAKGEDVNKMQKAVSKRTPPANADSYPEFRFDLTYKATRLSNCTTTCNGAFGSFARQCAASSPGIYMYEQGTYDIRCGLFSYRISNPFAKLQEFPRTCYKPTDMPPLKSGTPHELGVRSLAAQICKDDREITKGDRSTFLSLMTDPNAAIPYQFNIWWKDGCELSENKGLSKMKIWDPLMQGPGAGKEQKCIDTIAWNWKFCDTDERGRRGGTVQVGCLIYEFLPSNIRRTVFTN